MKKQPTSSGYTQPSKEDKEKAKRAAELEKVRAAWRPVALDEMVRLAEHGDTLHGADTLRIIARWALGVVGGIGDLGRVYERRGIKRPTGHQLEKPLIAELTHFDENEILGLLLELVVIDDDEHNWRAKERKEGTDDPLIAACQLLEVDWRKHRDAAIAASKTLAAAHKDAAKPKGKKAAPKKDAAESPPPLAKPKAKKKPAAAKAKAKPKKGK